MRTLEQADLLRRAQAVIDQIEAGSLSNSDDGLRALAEVPEAEFLIDAIAYLSADIVEAIEQIPDEPETPEDDRTRRSRLLREAEGAAKSGKYEAARILLDLSREGVQ